ncbi:hypothetical protein BDZ97DRAFT_1675059, partial [Flammula alnicola]
VYKILALYHEYGQVNPHAHRSGHPHILDMSMLNYISSLLDTNPTLYLDEIQEKHTIDGPRVRLFCVLWRKRPAKSIEKAIKSRNGRNDIATVSFNSPILYRSFKVHPYDSLSLSLHAASCGGARAIEYVDNL